MRTHRGAVGILLTLLSSAAHAETLSTTFTGNELGAGGWTNLFNLNVTNPLGIRITDISLNAETNDTRTVDIYAHPTTYAGNEGSSAGWVLVSTGSGPSPGFGGGVSSLDVADFDLAAGTYGIAIVNTNQRPYYTTGAQDFSDANLTIDNGATLRGTFGAQLDVDKTWNGSITYGVLPEPAGFAAAAFASVALGLRRRRRSRRA